MNADKMTREEFDERTRAIIANRASERCTAEFDKFWSRIEAIQSAPFVPDWSLKPKAAIGFSGRWVRIEIKGEVPPPGEFYIPAPSNPSDAELSAMFDNLNLDKKLKALRDAGVTW